MAQEANKGHRRGCLSSSGAFDEFSETGERRHFQRFGFDLALGQKPAQGFAAFEQVFRLRAVERRPVKRRVHNFLVADGNVEPRAELAKLFFVQLFLLMRDVAAFASFTQAVAFYRFGENDRGLALMFHCGLVCGVHLPRVVAAAQQLANLVVGQVIHHRQQLRVFAEKMFARIASGFDRVFLIVAVHRLFHAL